MFVENVALVFVVLKIGGAPLGPQLYNPLKVTIPGDEQVGPRALPLLGRALPTAGQRCHERQAGPAYRV